MMPGLTAEELALLVAIGGAVGGLLGSLVTVAVTKYFEMRQAEQEHRLAMKRVFFERKLDAAEAAVAQWSETTLTIGALVALFERPPILEGGRHAGVFISMLGTVLERINHLERQSVEVAQTFPLYFDFSSSFWERAYSGAYLDSLSRISAQLDLLNLGLQLLEERPDGEQADQIREGNAFLKDQLGRELDQFAVLNNNAREEMRGALSALREGMKRYEP
jgi:hypothetical protein